ncbi:MAG: MotA/TolQ/ExbB proton channel family protein, partial [Thermoleophilia bacterium]|nr:MotA/TolQ/ExbB proton channel family protein [Thermoleophilia bacterium]
MNLLLATSPGDTITNAVNDIAKSLRYPVLILALLALAFVAYELGRLGVEAFRRSQRNKERFDILARRAQQFALAGDSAGAQAILNEYAYGKSLREAAVSTMFAANPLDAQRAVVDYDIYVSKRLDRVRLLVRSGPALGLMGTLIPLAPALAALGKGDVEVLASKLQTAFAITVVGVAIGLVAFAVALVRERFYTKDLADLEFLREIRGDSSVPTGAATGAAPAPAHVASSQGTDVTDAPTTVSPAAAAAAPRAVAPAAAPPPPVAVQPPVMPAAPTGGKKKFGIKRKSKTAAPIAAPLPAFPPPPAPVIPNLPPP